MIDLYYAPTPNCWKVSIMLEECGLSYRVVPVFLGKGEQYKPAFLERNPNNRIPVMVDSEGADDGGELTLFESGAILLYLAEKSGMFLPQGRAGRYAATQWLMWQMSSLGPMLGQHGHFALYAQQPEPYALNRFRSEALRLYGVLDTALRRNGPYIAGGEYSIADIACFPWVMTHKAQKFSLDDFPFVKDWFARLRARPPLQAGLAVARNIFVTQAPVQGAERDRLFGTTPSRPDFPVHFPEPLP